MGISISPLNVRRSILIEASAQRVWKEFETFSVLEAWFGIGHKLHQFEPKLGGQVKLSIEADDSRRHFGGSIVIWEPAKEITFENNWEEPHAWPLSTFFTIRLTPLYNATTVELFHHGFERLGIDAADTLQAYEGGWDITHLKALRTIVER